MRVLVLLAIASAFLIWLGLFLRTERPRVAAALLIVAGILMLLFVGGFFDWFGLLSPTTGPS
ncbi:MAG: hypothetical protein JSW10_04070 [Pseudomonadota bacterium]|nr:MAG: hypothetical protein JSW10_04070 [Pseudomonadota bacterium]